jgi:hypothetical protein
VAKANYTHRLIDVRMEIEMYLATIIFFPPFLLLFLVHVVILFLSFSLTGIALLSSVTVHSEEKKKKKNYSSIISGNSSSSGQLQWKTGGHLYIYTKFIIIFFNQHRLFFDIHTYIYLLETNTSFNIKSNAKYN